MADIPNGDQDSAPFPPNGSIHLDAQRTLATQFHVERPWRGDSTMLHVSPPAATLEALAGPLRHIAAEGEHVVLESNGQPLAALISMEDLAVLERLMEEEEDRLDIAEVKRIKAEMAATGEKPVAFEDFLREEDARRLAAD